MKLRSSVVGGRTGIVRGEDWKGNVGGIFNVKDQRGGRRVRGMEKGKRKKEVQNYRK